MISLAIVGVGYAAQKLHWPALKRSKRIKVVAACDAQADRAGSLGIATQQFGTILDNPMIQAVAILTPPDSHGDLLRLAAAAGKHVFVEKPLVAARGDLSRIRKAAHGAAGVIAAGHNMRCHRLARMAKKAILDGRIGKVLSIHLTWTSDLRTSNADIALDIGVHHIDLIGWLLDAPVVSAKAIRFGNNLSADGVTSGGVPFHCFWSKESIARHTAQIIGEKGILEFSFLQANSWREFGAQSLGMRGQIESLGQGLSQTGALMNGLGGGDWLSSYEEEWDRFAASVESGAPVACTVEEAAKAVEICLGL